MELIWFPAICELHQKREYDPDSGFDWIIVKFYARHFIPVVITLSSFGTLYRMGPKRNRAIEFDLFHIGAAVLAISAVTWVH